MIAGVIVLALAVTWVIIKNQPSNEGYAFEVKQEELRSPNTTKVSKITQPLLTVDNSSHVLKPQPSDSPILISEHKVTQVIDDLQKLATSYDAVDLPKIDPYLLHSNAEIRGAAIEAMVTLGDASAGSLLRIAAAKVTSPHEAVALLEAADYVELPPAKLKFKKKK